MWISVYPLMNKDTYVSFDEYYGRAVLKVSAKSAEEIYKEALEIQQRLHAKKALREGGA